MNITETTPERPAVMRATHAFAVPGSETIVDMIHPETGRSICYDHSLEQIRERYPSAEIVEFSAWMDSKTARQAAVPREWTAVSEETYWEMLEVLPPAARSRGAFLVGEPMDHDCSTGRPRFACYRETKDGTHWVLSTPITFREFNSMFGPAQSTYIE